MNFNTYKFTRLVPLAVLTTALVWLVSASSVSAQTTYSNAVAANSPLAYWRFSELGNPASGTLPAADSSGNGYSATYGSNCLNGFNGIVGPRPSAFPGFETTNVAVQTGGGLEATQSWVAVPTLSLNTNTVTFTMWIYMTSNNPTYSPGLFWQRGGSSGGSGLGISGSHLYYDWNNNSSNIYNWSSNLKPPTNTWAFVALTIEPVQATLRLYYIDPNTGVTNLLSTNNITTHSNQQFNGTIAIGCDTFSYSNRTFVGAIDEAAVFTNTLSSSALGNLFATGLGAAGLAPRISTQPASAAVSLGQTAQFMVLADGTPLNYQWQAAPNGGAFTNLIAGAKYGGSTNASLFITNVSAADVLNYQVVISNSFGSVTSSVVTLQLSALYNVPLTNASFEIPPTVSGWYQVPASGGMTNTFGWSNNLPANGYVIAAPASGQFSAAADGTQAMRLYGSTAYFISQDTGPTASNTFYSLNFSVLQAETTNAGAAINASIIDGSNTLATSDFAVPGTNNIWQAHSLTALSPPSPNGHLTIKFTAPSGSPLLDKVSLTAEAAPISVILTNASFEIPGIPSTNGGWWLGAIPASFGWSNNLGTYVLGTSGAGHFSSAASGTQALILNVSQYIQQDIGPTASNTVYNLTFTLLQDKYTPDTNPPVALSTLSAQIFSGASLLASNNFTVPSNTNDWNAYILTVTSPPAPAGDLIIKFSGVTAPLPGYTGPLLDKVALTAVGLYEVPPAITTQPLSQTNECASTATLTAAATGTPAPAYQWYYNGGAVANGTGTSLTLTNASTGQGTYTVVASNAWGSVTSAPAVLTVVDTTPPTVTLLGANPLTNECHAAFADPGATANDTCAGSLPVTTNSTVNPNAVGTYTINYVATDPSGNSATNTRTVRIVDTTPPSVTLLGANPLTNECHAAFADPGATANDTCAGSLPITTNSTVNPNAVGTYTIKYVATDPSGNSATNTRTVRVVDTTPPAITVNGANPLYVECHGAYTDPGATALDACAGAVAVRTNGTVNTMTTGTNTVTYVADDGNGNTNQATRTVIVQDTTPPAIVYYFTNLTLSTTSSNCQALLPDLTGTNYIIAVDACSSSVTVTQNPPANTWLPLGTNEVVLTALDSSDNATNSTNTVVVADQTAPVITLVGASPLTNECHSAFVDPGATAWDNCSGVVSVSTNGAVDPNTVGVYTIAYVASDATGNLATNTRTVYVVDTTAPVMTLNGANPLYVECHSGFSDPGASANDACAGSVSVSVIGTVNANSPGSYTLTYSATDPSGNTSSTNRTVIVQDTTPPAITYWFTNLVLGAASSNCDVALPDLTGTNYIIAVDTCSSSVTVTQMPPIGTVLSYGTTNVVVLTALDASGNAAYSTNTVCVVEGAAPVITAQPQSLTNLVGTDAAFTVEATSCGPVSYQWYMNTNVLANETNADLTVTDVQLADAGSYTVTLANAAGSSTSAVAVLTADLPPVAANTNAGVTENQALVLANFKLLAQCSDPQGYPLSIISAGPTSTNGGTVSLTSSNITYVPVTNYVGLDLFNYTVSDGVGTATGSVLVTVSPASAPPPDIVSGPEILPDGHFHVGFAGIPGFSYTVQYAPEVDGPWTTLTNLTADDNGLFDFEDPTEPPPPTRYYRTQYP